MNNFEKNHEFHKSRAGVALKKKFLSAEWRKLAIANYMVDPGILRPFLPYRTELDDWQGNHYISLVGFRFINTRLLGLSFPFHRNFEEVNLRFYVRFKENGIWKRGVSFIREIVPRHALTFIANMVYGEKYITLPMRHRIEEDSLFLRVSYEWKIQSRWNSFSVTAERGAHEIAAGTEEEFITEHYWGYTQMHESCCGEYQVDHPRWLMYRVKESAVEVSFAKLYGSRFAFLDHAHPASVMLAEGSEIAVFSRKQIRRS